MSGALGIAIFSTIITFVGFVQSNLPSGRPSDKQTTFRFHAGMDGTRGSNGGTLTNAGGDLPDIRVWNENGKFIGAKYDPGKLKEGHAKEVTVSLSQGHQPTYVLFTGNNDALCISYVTQRWADGTEYGWIGNWADNKACKRSWYYSNVWVKDKKVNCAWIDRNGDLPITGIQVHFPEFDGTNKNKNRGKNYFCNQNPPLRFHTSWEPNTVRYWTSNKKRNALAIDGGSEDGLQDDDDDFVVAETAPEPAPYADPRPFNPGYQDYNDTRLVRSSDPIHTATFLCEDELSRGPDLVSLSEGLFCNMATREVLPLCNDKPSADCFDDASLRVKRAIAIRDDHHIKEYTDIIEWGY